MSMTWKPRAHARPLAELLRRMSIALEAGIDLRKVLASETRRVPPAFRPHLETLAAKVRRGIPLSEAFDLTGDFFPELVRKLVPVGEHTGHLPRVLKQLAEHYEQQLTLRRLFLSGVAWPMVQLAAALFIVGFLIAISGWMEGRTGQPFDPLGWGLTGTSGLIIYLVLVAALLAGLVILYRSAVAGRFGTAPLQRAVLRVPQLGGALRTLAVARFAWTLHLAMDSTMPVQQALALALASTRNVEFTSRREQILASLARGQEIHEALDRAGVFPDTFIQSVLVGEESGRLVESMGVVARRYHEEARSSLAILARIAAFAVWLGVAGFIAMLIIRLFGSYLSQLPQ